MRLARPSLRWLAVAALARLACVGANSALAQTPIADIQRAEPVDFEKEILPVLKRNCIACHNAAKPEKGLSLETPQSIAKGGDSGAAVTPRDSASSLLLLVASVISPSVLAGVSGIRARRNRRPGTPGTAEQLPPVGADTQGR